MMVLRGLVLVLAALFTLLTARIVVGKALGDVILARAEAEYVEVFGSLPESLPPPPEVLEVPVALDLTAAERDALRAVERGVGTPEQIAAVGGIARPGSELVPLADVDATRWMGAARLYAARGWVALAGADAPALEQEAAALVDLTVGARSHPYLIGTLVATGTEVLWHRLARAAAAADPNGGSWVDSGLLQLAAARDLAAAVAGEGALQLDSMPGALLDDMPKGLALIFPWRAAHFRADALIARSDFVRRVRSPEPWVKPLERGLVPPLGAWLDPLSVPGITASVLIPGFDSLARAERRLLSARRITRCGLALRSGSSPHKAACVGLVLTTTATGVELADPTKLPEADTDRDRELLLWALAFRPSGP